MKSGRWRQRSNKKKMVIQSSTPATSTDLQPIYSDAGKQRARYINNNTRNTYADSNVDWANGADDQNDIYLDTGPDVHTLDLYPHIAASACFLVRSTIAPFRFGVSTGEFGLSELYAQLYTFRKDIVEKGPYIDFYLGATRVYKRVSKCLLYAFCPDIGRAVVCCNSRFVVQLPHGFSNVLSVKLAVGYMEECVLQPRFRSSPWQIPAYSSLCDYISLAELFAYIGCAKEAKTLEQALVRRLKEAPLRMEQIRSIWGRENPLHPSKYAEAMARNIVTWFCVPRLEAWMAQWDLGWDVAKSESTYVKCGSIADGDGVYAEVVVKRIRELAETYEIWKVDRKNALFKARHATNFLDQFLEDANNVALKQLVWTADAFEKAVPEDPAEFITIVMVQAPLPARHLAGMRKVEWRKKGEHHAYDNTT